MIASKKNIADALTDVRKAYRILHNYQRAALDAANYLGSQLGFEYRGGYPLFSDCAPKDGKGKLENWSWDWLNLVFYDFHFVKRIDNQDQNLSIWLFSDTGYFFSDSPKADKTDVSTFAPVETSQSKVAFLLYGQWKNEFNAFKDSREEVRRFLETDNELPRLLKAGGVIGRCCDFSQISDEDSADVLLDELVQFGRANRFPLERVAKVG